VSATRVPGRLVVDEDGIERAVAVMPTNVASDALTRDRVRRWAVSGRLLPTALARLRSEADRYRLENAVQLRHLTASIVVPAATLGAVVGCGGSKADSNAARSGGSAAPAGSNGPSLTLSNFAVEAASITVRRGARVTDNARAAGGSIA
jgi:hypothetical protein